MGEKAEKMWEVNLEKSAENVFNYLNKTFKHPVYDPHACNSEQSTFQKGRDGVNEQTYIIYYIL